MVGAELPAISILIPTRNRAEFLQEAIESCLRQSYSNTEIVICDNCSTDKTASVSALYVERYPRKVRYFKNTKDIGPILNWKAAYEYANGRFVLLLSDDDFLIDDDYLTNAVRILESMPNVAVVIGEAVVGKEFHGQVIKDTAITYIPGNKFIQSFWQDGYEIPSISNVFRKGTLKPESFWTDPDCPYSDIELWLKLMMHGDAAVLHSKSIFYRHHGANIVFNIPLEAYPRNAAFIERVIEYYEQGYGSATDASKLRFSLFEKYYKFCCRINGEKWLLKEKMQLSRELRRMYGLPYSYLATTGLWSVYQSLVQFMRLLLRRVKRTASCVANIARREKLEKNSDRRR